MLIKEQQHQLEQLMLSEDLEELNGLTGDFNIFNALNMQNNEIRHSNFLGWLLKPYESHNLGDYFLKEILKISLRHHSRNESIKTRLEDIIFNSFEDSEIVLEKLTDKNRRIDIFIDSPENQFICLIENKIWSGEGIDQLKDYKTYIENHEKYKNYKHKVFIFLTPNTDYNKEALYKNYIRIDYSQICEVINKMLKFKEKSMSEEVRFFIEHYKKMVERNIMGNTDEEIVTLCKKIYREHKEAIDLIIENTDINTELMDLLIKIVTEKSEIVNPHSSSIHSLPKGIKDLEKLKYGEMENWLQGSIIGLYLAKGKMNVDFGISIQKTDTKLEDRRNLVSILEKEYGNFRNRNDSWRWFSLETISQDEFCEIEDINEFKVKIEQKFASHINKFCNILNNI
ncbi:MAG: PD-(D/E)XK nuclease family protein [Candidatus Gastranaerophilales bacterium]|nr:PD-(D/E)XK nuclease family protein [Candidatus Gastranaerophilales bacterium]